MDPTRGTVDLIGHVLIPAKDLSGELEGGIQNIVIRAKSDQGKWIEESSLRIGHWRAMLRSVYMHWAMAINGLFVAAERYQSQEWQSKGHMFKVDGLKSDKDGNVDRVTLAIWDGDQAAENHLETAGKMAAWGYVELYAVVESMVMDFYTIYIQNHPQHLLQGKENASLRSSWKQFLKGEIDQSVWEPLWQERVSNWQRKKAYTGLGDILKAYYSTSELLPPSNYKKTTQDTWAASLDGVGLIRHSIVHGVTQVSQELDDFCKQPYALGFEFTEGDELKLETRHLQLLEVFAEQLLGAFNISLVEHADSSM